MSIIDIATLGLFLSDRRENSGLAFIGRIGLGVVAGFIGSKLINKTGGDYGRRGVPDDLSARSLVGGVRQRRS